LTIVCNAPIFNLVVELKADELDTVFRALGDATRREMLARLARQECTVSELAEPFDMSLAAASKHIKALENAGLVQRTINGRTHVCRLAPAALAEAHQWLGFYQRFWTDRLDALERELNAEEKAVKSKTKRSK
jgi:DNA-binding transcriptional ArsR family regulator